MKNRTILVIGDFIALAIVTIIGFTTHGEANASFLPRMTAVYLPLAISWFIIAPWFGLFNPEVTSDFKQLWRPALAMVFAAPFAIILRGLLLNAPVIPVFAVVLSVTSALGMLIWRGICSFIYRGKPVS